MSYDSQNNFLLMRCIDTIYEFNSERCPEGITFCLPESEVESGDCEKYSSK